MNWVNHKDNGIVFVECCVADGTKVRPVLLIFCSRTVISDDKVTPSGGLFTYLFRLLRVLPAAGSGEREADGEAILCRLYLRYEGISFGHIIIIASLLF